MEFGIFVSTPLFGASSTDPAAEHAGLMNDVELVLQAERYGIKYAWVSEHHALTEYSHLSASECFIPYVLALTSRIHVGAGIWPLNPVTNHPIRIAERAAMCDHLSQGRFEFGTGRGAGSHEIGIFNLTHDQTKANWDEVIREFRKMWAAGEYSHDGPAFSTPRCSVIPKPYGGSDTHPPMWLAVGSPATFEKAGHYGLGALGFGLMFSSGDQVRKYVDIYREAQRDAEPVGHYVNDNFLVAQTVLCLDDPKDAREALIAAQPGYMLSLLHRYHDTIPRPEDGPVWPDLFPEPTMSDVERMIQSGAAIGSPDEVIAALRAYEAAGVDQIAFGLPIGLPHDVAMEMIRVIGEKVVPHFDNDAEHRSSRMRYHRTKSLQPT